MRSHLFALMAALGLLVSSPTPLLAQGASSDPGMSAPKRSRSRSSSTRPKREPTVGQLAARDRLRKCGVEWREAKGRDATGGLKWPQYYSKCNARLKGNQA